MSQESEIAEGLQFRHIYWVRGKTPKHYALRNEVTTPPCSGWGHAYIIPGERRSTIFCPYSFEAFTVSNKSLEVAGSEEPRYEWTLERAEKQLNEKWNELQKRGAQKDYTTAIVVMKKLGLEIPAEIMTGGGEDERKKGGKETSSKLLKPVKATSKRGKFLKWFLDGDGSRSVREAMAEFGMSRSNALSYLYMIQKDHGIGYELVGDTATVTLPEGCSDPFNEQPAPAPVEEDDDSWLD